MKPLWTFLALLMTTACLAFAPALPARAATARGVTDKGNFFSPDAEARAKAIIDQVFDRHHGKEILIETFNELPGGQDVANVAKQRATAANLNGMYIAVVRKGGQVYILPDSQLRKVFNQEVGTQLQQQFTADLRKGPQNFDTALMNAVQFISDKMNQSDKPTAAAGGTTAGRTGGSPVPPSPGANSGSSTGGGTYVPPGPTRRTSPTGCGVLPGSLMGWICLIAGVWLIFGLIRGMFRGRSGGGYGPGGYAPGPGGGGYGGGPVGPGYGYGGGYGGGGWGGGGGGWGSSILGGMFGAAAGNWIYDRFARGGGSAYGQTPPADTGGYAGGAAGGAAGAGPTEPDWAQTGGDFSGGGYGGSSGTDFGSGGGGGGGDFGGGGGGGGDFGGGGGFGDSGGGGGGDFGGGGFGDSGGGGGGDFA